MSFPILILASQSPRRTALLKKAGIKFKKIPSRIKETTRFRKPSSIVKDMACRKAMAVAVRHPRSPVLGADTIVYCRGKIIGKPKSRKHALKMLSMQNGAWQTVYSGVSLVWLSRGLCISGCDMAECKARKLAGTCLEQIAVKHLDKAGGYAAQDSGDFFIERIKGRYDTVVGLPMNIVIKFLRKAGIAI